MLLGELPFNRFMSLTDWLFATTAQTHKIALSRLFTMLHEFMTTVLDIESEIVENALSDDYKHNRLKGFPKFKQHATPDQILQNQKSGAQRQHRHTAN